MRFLHLFLILSLIFVPTLFQTLNADELPIYVLVDVLEQADFDYNLLDNIDNISPPYPEYGSFMIGDIPTKQGDFTLYKFVSPFYAFSSEPPLDEKTVFHNILTIKTDKNKQIIDAYHYAPQWQDTPSIKLFRLSIENLVLSKELSISKLAMKNADGELLSKDGIIDDFYRAKLMFSEESKPIETITLTLDVSALSEEKDTIKYEPNRRLKRPSYTTYFFNKDEFEAKVGQLPLNESKTIEIEIIQTRNQNHTPSSPMMSSPSGGFNITHHQCRIIRIR